MRDKDSLEVPTQPQSGGSSERWMGACRRVGSRQESLYIECAQKYCTINGNDTELSTTSVLCINIDRTTITRYTVIGPYLFITTPHSFSRVPNYIVNLLYKMA